MRRRLLLDAAGRRRRSRFVFFASFLEGVIATVCGIVGFTRKTWFPGPDRIRAAVATIIHRGPDQQGVFESNLVSLGATRLKIIDLAAGDQPMSSEGGGAVIVFNGEVYNYQELRQELEARGHKFRTRTDTETVLRGFLEWDTECFKRLRGMFAVALWIESQKRLVLARDRMGIKPLYIARRGEDLLFGSELKTIFVHPEVDRHLSTAALDCYLSLNYVPGPLTMVEGIEQLPPGEFLEWRDGRMHAEAYWRLPHPQPRMRPMEDAQQELDSLLRDSVREHLVSDVPLGVWLSGGIDSSTVLHYAAQASPSKLKTLSISFPGRSFDESDYIRQVVAQYGSDHQQLDLGPEVNLRDAIEDFAYYADEPNADAGALPVWFLSKMSKTKVTVTLSGEGGDELFGGYLTYRANHYAKAMARLPRSLVRLALGGVRAWPVSDDKISFEYKLKRLLEGSLMPPERAHVFWNGTFSDEQKRRLVRLQLPAALEATLADLRQAGASGEDFAPYLWFDQKYYLPDDILNKVDRMSMAHALEVRPPLLDHRIVEFAATLPPSFKMQGSRQKVILKNLMKGRLPDSVLRRSKVGFDIPAHQWLRGPLKSLLLDTIDSACADPAGLFDRAAIDAVVGEHMERRANLGYHLWGLMILFLWTKRWRIQTAPVSGQSRPVAERVLTST
jgi:asparagine synthase (glutamine-hydrolysing)